MRISDWSSDVCSSDLGRRPPRQITVHAHPAASRAHHGQTRCDRHATQTHHSLTPLADRTAPPPPARDTRDRKSVVSGKSVSVRVDLGGRRIIKKKNNTLTRPTPTL